MSTALENVQKYIEDQKASGAIDVSSGSWRTSLPHFPELEYGEGESYTWKLETSEGDIEIEFMPELVGAGPRKHMMCYEPGGIRVEFIWPGD